MNSNDKTKIQIKQLARNYYNIPISDIYSDRHKLSLIVRVPQLEFNFSSQIRQIIMSLYPSFLLGVTRELNSVLFKLKLKELMHVRIKNKKMSN